MKSQARYLRPIDFFETGRSLKTIRDYVFLFQCYHGRLEDVERLKALIPDYKDQHDREKIRQKLQKMSVPMLNVFERIGAPVEVEWETKEHGYDHEKKIPTSTKIKHTANIFTDQFSLSGEQPTTFYQMIGYLEQAEGAYEHIRIRRKRQFFNPVFIVASLLRIPLRVMEYMGVDTSDEHINKVVVWLIQTLLAILILLLIARLGLDVSFDQLITRRLLP